jgi:hypothetical protein
MIGFAESEDIGPLPPIAQFARYVLFVKAIGPHAEASAMPASGHPGFGEIEIPACAGMTRRPAAIQSESAFPPRRACSSTGRSSSGNFPTLEASEKTIHYATVHEAARRAKRKACLTSADG